MPLKPRYHYAWFEAQTPDKDGCVKLPGSRLVAKKFGNKWKVGENRVWGCVAGRYGYHKGPFKPYGGDAFYPDRIEMNGQYGIMHGLGIKQRSRISNKIKSPLYQWGPFEVQGEGSLLIEHTPDGSMLNMRTECPALEKTWHKDRYAEEKKKRAAANRALKIMMKMGVLGDGTTERDYSYWRQMRGEIDKIDIASLMHSLAEADGTTDNAQLEKLGQVLLKFRAISGYKTPEEAFQALQPLFRDVVYKQKNVYTWEPVLDGRDRVDL